MRFLSCELLILLFVLFFLFFFSKKFLNSLNLKFYLSINFTKKLDDKILFKFQDEVKIFAIKYEKAQQSILLICHC